MGDRANIAIEFEDHQKTPVYFYTHWNGTELPVTLQNALIRGRDRWDDEAYLARIIFSEMIQGAVLSETGFGISLNIQDNEHPIITVDMKLQSVRFNNYEWTFEQYVSLTFDEINKYYEER